MDPEILFFDEPFSALDPLIRREMQDELINLQEQMQKTIVFITHDFLEAIKLADYLAIMKDGEIVQMGTPQDIVLHPADDYVQEFTEDVPHSHAVTAGAIMRPPQPDDDPGQMPVTHPDTTLHDLVPIAAERDSRIAVHNGSGELIGIVDRARSDAGASRPEVDEDDSIDLIQIRYLLINPDPTLPVVDLPVIADPVVVGVTFCSLGCFYLSRSVESALPRPDRRFPLLGDR